MHSILYREGKIGIQKNSGLLFKTNNILFPFFFHLSFLLLDLKSFDLIFNGKISFIFLSSIHHKSRKLNILCEIEISKKIPDFL